MPSLCLRIALFVIAAVASGCSSGSSGTPTPMGPSAPALSHLSIFPPEQVTTVGGEVILTVTARDLAGADVPGLVPTYTSPNPSVVQVHPDGRVAAEGVGTVTLRATAGGQAADVVLHVGAATYDLAGGPPRILDSNYIDLMKIARISRFRSTIGHNYTNDTGEETCRSMKHYYQPKLTVVWTGVDIYSPAEGTIVELRSDGSAGFQIRLLPRALPAMQVLLFHVNPNPELVRGTWVESGQHIGRHASSGTMSDISMSIGPKEGGTLLSYFQTMTDEIFALYQTRGVPSREAAVITRAQRDADPVPCVGEQQFAVHGTIPDWLELN